MLAVLMGAGAALCAFLFSLLLAKQQRALGDAWIACWLGLYGVYFVAGACAFSTTGALSLALGLAAQAAAVLLGPTQFLHAWRVTGADMRRSGGYAAATLLLLAAVLTLPLLAPVRAEAGAVVADNPPAWLIAFPISGIALSVAYPIAALRRLRQYRANLKLRLSNLHKADLAWTHLWALSTIALLLAQAAVLGISLTLKLAVPLHVALLLTAQVAQVAFVGWRALAQTQIFDLRLGDDGDGRNTRDDLEEARADLAQLEALITSSAPHLDSDLTAAGLADCLGWAPYRLTQALRLGGNTTFHDFINRARVETLKRLALDPKNARISLLSLALDAGFGSKSALYEAFNAAEGMSPARWRREKMKR